MCKINTLLFLSPSVYMLPPVKLKVIINTGSNLSDKALMNTDCSCFVCICYVHGHHIGEHFSHPPSLKMLPG